MVAALVVLLRTIGLLCRGHRAVALENAALRQQLSVLRRVVSGLLLLTPRIAHASSNSIFRLKMLLLCAATAFHFAIYRDAARGVRRALLGPGVVGALGLALWSGVVLAGCAFILFE